MNKIRCFFLFVFGGLLSATVMEAQEVDFEKEFDDFQKQQQKEFNDFKNKADADFETFLRETWVKFEAFDPLKAPVRPEPEKQLFLMENGLRLPWRLNRLILVNLLCRLLQTNRFRGYMYRDSLICL